MTPFLKQVARHYFTKEGLEKTCFIFPNRRSMSFFRKYLGECLRDAHKADLHVGPIVCPTMVTVNDLFYRASGVEPSDRVTLLLKLYDCYKEVNPQAEPLDEFIFWGDVILADFNDVDKYLVSPKQLFTNIADYKEIQADYDFLTQEQREAIERLVDHFKNSESDPEDGVKKRFLKIWNILLPLYNSFNEQLSAENLSYEGMVYRSLAERLGKESVADVMGETYPGVEKFVFVGLNALNECEKRLLGKLRDAKMAEFCWDYTGKMIQDKSNRSSFFMSQNVKDFPQVRSWDIDGVGLPRINVLSVNSSIGQAKLLSKVFPNPAVASMTDLTIDPITGATIDPITGTTIDPVTDPTTGTTIDQPSTDLSDIYTKDELESLYTVKKEGKDVEERVYFDDCAVVLPDENLLLPVLNSLPPYLFGRHLERKRDWATRSEVEEMVEDGVNITMGCPLSSSSIWNLLQSISAMQLHLRRNGDKCYFYHRQVWAIFANGVFRKASSEKAEEIVMQIKKQAKFYIPQEDFSGDPLLELIFQPIVVDPALADSAQTEALRKYQMDVIAYCAPKLLGSGPMALEMEFSKGFFKALNILPAEKLPVLPSTYFRIVARLTAGISVHFEGEPLKGFQVMGPLETRCLDFKNLVIMSANEGVFPRKSVSSSFIPPELRRGFGLPTYEYQDAVWAYYFYRMITRAENVWMIMDSRTEGMKVGEESRYIKQLEYYFNVPIKFYAAKAQDVINPVAEDIDKIPEDLAALDHLSASAIETYFDCQAKFYYKYVKRLKIDEDVKESMDAGIIGTIFHTTMQLIYAKGDWMHNYEPFDSKKTRVTPLDEITSDYLKQWLTPKGKEDIRKKVYSLICHKLNTVEVTGRDLIMCDVIVQYVIKALEHDKKIIKDNGCPIRLVGLELEKTCKCGGVDIVGTIDRLDRFEDGTIRVVDYKTGKVTDAEKHLPTPDGFAGLVDKVFTPEYSKDRPKILLQLFIYDKFIMENNEDNVFQINGVESISNSIYSISDLFTSTPATDSVRAGFYDMMDKRLEELVAEIFSTDKKFARVDPSKKLCEKCDFRALCGR